MKILKLLNKISLLFFFVIFIFNSISFAEDKPVDIWNLDKSEIEKKTNDLSQDSNENLNTDENSQNSSIYNMQSQKKDEAIKQESAIKSDQIKIVGLYDPEDYGLDINMWLNSDGDQLKNIFNNLSKINLSEEAKEIMNISILTNAYYPKKNISEEEFSKIKSDWLIKNSNLDLIEEYLIKNQILNLHPELTKYLIDQHLIESNIQRACKIFFKNQEPLEDNYLSKFNIYCLVDSGKINEAQIILDLKKESGFKDNYFEKKISFLMGYEDKVDKTISEKTILDFHLAHRTDPEFYFEPKDSTDKKIWRYLSSSNLLRNLKEIEISELDKISLLEKAAHNKNYPEKDLFDLYKRFQFSINQFLNINDSYKNLSNIEARALLYQKILLESEVIEKLKLLKTLKELFKKDQIEKAFDIELKNFLEKIEPSEVPVNLTSFYYTNIKIEDNSKKSIKYNNNVIHQSKLVNYFNGDYSKSKIEKDINNFLKKVKKDKKYFFLKKI